MTDCSESGRERPEIAYLLPGLFISGGIGVVLRHVVELRRRGRRAVVFVIDRRENGAWFPAIGEVPVYPLDEYYAVCGESGACHLAATWWENAFDIAALDAGHKHWFIQSLESRFFAEGHVFRDAFYLSLLLGLNLFTEARWIRDWLKSEVGVDAVVAPNGVDGTMFYPDPSPQKRAKLRVLIEGPAGVPFKGVADCFEAVRNLDVEVWYVSPRDDPDPAWKVDRCFKAVPMTDMRGIYTQCDVLLKLSKVEGVFGPPLEMMACGGTCVVGNVTGHDEYCVHGKNCLIVDKDSPEEARQALLRLMQDRSLLERLKGEGPKTAAAFPWAATIDVLEQRVFHDGAAAAISFGNEVRNSLIQVKTHLGRMLHMQGQFKQQQLEAAELQSRIVRLKEELSQVRLQAKVREAEYGMQIEQLRALLDQSRSREAELRGTLDEIYHSIGWRWLNRCYRFRDVLFPHASVRRTVVRRLFPSLFG